jgi:hypothetical protein
MSNSSQAHEAESVFFAERGRRAQDERKRLDVRAYVRTNDGFTERPNKHRRASLPAATTIALRRVTGLELASALANLTTPNEAKQLR